MTYRIELIIINNALDYANDNQQCKRITGENLYELVKSAYPKGLPLNTSLYHKKWNVEHDITPKTEQDVAKLSELTGRFYLVTYPAGGAFAIIAAVISLVVSVAAVFLMPKPQVETGNRVQPPSPNNSLSDRVNRQRLGGRVSEIFGKGYVMPDLCAPSYRYYVDHKETENTFMTVGVGRHHVFKAFDDTTPSEQLLGNTVLVYDPNTTLNDAPVFQFGSAFTPDEAEWSRYATKRYTAVNGQELPSPNGYVSSALAFNNPNTLTTSESNIDFTSYFSVGSNILIENANNLASGNNVLDNDNNPVTYTLNGIYEVATVTAKTITLLNPETVNPDWQKLTDNQDLIAETNGITLSTQTETLWQGWFYTSNKEHTGAYINIVAVNGLYKNNDRGDKWHALNIEGVIESEIVDSNDNPVTGTLVSQPFNITPPKYDVYGDSYTTDNNLRGSAGKSIRIENPNMAKGKKLRFRIARTTNRVSGASVVQDIRIKDFYGFHVIENDECPKDVTTCYVKQRATEGALALKQRKTRLYLQRYVNTPSGEVLSSRIDDIIYHLAIDPNIGRLQASDLDFEQMKAEVDAQIDYFGTPLTAEFNGTFDKNNVTFEETAQTVAQAGMMKAYQLGKINLHFERLVSAPIANFNSRNILPDSFEYDESFGRVDDKDGVKVIYSDPADDTQAVLHFPADQSATNPRKVELVGVRNKVQAHMIGMRQYNKDQFAYKSCSFSGADETGIVIPSNVVQVANQTFAEVRQGYVEDLEVDEQGNTILYTDACVELEPEQQATVFVQTVARTVDAIPCVRHSDYSLRLGRAPHQAISTDKANVVNATYQIVTHDDLSRDWYIVSSKKPDQTPLAHELECVNYDPRYYQADTDFKNGLIA